MAERRSRKISMFIFLFALFILLAVITGAYLYKLYSENTASSEKQTRETIDCDYYFAVSKQSISYIDDKLSFEIKNTYGKEIRTVVIVSGNETKEKSVSLTRGDSFPLDVSIKASGNFSLYPKGCPALAKVFQIP